MRKADSCDILFFWYKILCRIETTVDSEISNISVPIKEREQTIGSHLWIIHNQSQWRPVWWRVLSISAPILPLGLYFRISKTLPFRTNRVRKSYKILFTHFIRYLYFICTHFIRYKICKIKYLQKKFNEKWKSEKKFCPALWLSRRFPILISDYTQ